MVQEPGNVADARTDIAKRVEALLFASDIPLSKARLSALTGASSVKEISDALESLSVFYRESERSFGIVELAGGYQIVTLPDYSAVVAGLFKSRRKARLTQAALETLAIIAYKQPISRLDIEAIRGVNCDAVLSTLTERELITITGRGEGVGKPFLYSTTRKFLEYVGLKDYRDLPSMEELEKTLEVADLVPLPEREDIGGSSTGEAEQRQEGIEEENRPE